ncbi:putative ABC transporter permease [Aminipila sp.]|uniref:putative ABC transporter permease n=1 Tax=Aminipila sp. TaxID=2060095 RepID=UPI0028A160A9|nr:putative ABC transporter permease [Aminipila sp.]
MYEYFCYFVIYSFLGWCMEVAYAAVNSGKFVNRGFLNGPVCPIYGFGMITVIACLTPLMYNKIYLFLGAVLLTSALEWLTGFILEKLFRGKWWDYSNMPFNLNGYICLKFSILWGLACIIIMDVLHPAIRIIVAEIPVLAGKSFVAVSFTVMLVDLIGTVVTVNKLNRQLAHLDEISERLRMVSNELGENIYEGVTAIKEKSDVIIERSEELKEELERKAEELKNELRKAYEEEIGKRFFGQIRLIKAFPDFKSIKNSDHLAKLKEKIRQL